jgi:fumiquinazoline A oxidase
MVPWNQELQAAFFGLQNGACNDQNYVNIYSLSLNQTDVSTWESYFADLAEFYVQYPEYQGRLLAERYPTQAVLAVPDSKTAYAYREAKTQLYVTTSFPIIFSPNFLI